MEQKLGRGLAALFGESSGEMKENNSNMLAIEDIIANESQPRKDFNNDQLTELAESIKLHGVLQPIAVRPYIDGKYIIIAGERRWRAAKMAGLKRMPVIVLRADTDEAQALALIENIQRADLNPIEEAYALKSLIEAYSCSQEEIAVMLSKSRSYVTNMLRLLNLPEYVQHLVREGQLSSGHARCLVNIDNAQSIADMIIRQNWNVRQTEDYIKMLKFADRDTRETLPVEEMRSEMTEIAERIEKHIGVPTQLLMTKYGGRITFHCRNYEELNTLVDKLVNI